MKKLVYILLALIVVFSACDPNEDLYDELDNAKEPYAGKIESYVFTADDYAIASDYAIKDAVTDEDTSNAEAIEDDEAFNTYFTAESYVGKVLGELFPEYNKKSSANVTYNNFIGGLEYLDELGDITFYTLEWYDYDSMGEGDDEPGDYNNFSYKIDPDDYLPAFLLTKYSSAEADDVVAITYQYYDNGTSTLTDYYGFDGTEWSVQDPVPGVYILSDDDYDAMGSPGNYGNFSSSDSPDDYLPAFLSATFIYAKAGDVKVVVYQYYSSGSTTTRAKEYHYDGSVWTEYDATITQTNQFVHNGTEWVFDPTITLVMSGTEYQVIVDYAKATYGPDVIDSYGTADYVYGVSAYYGNFDGSKWDKTKFEDWDEALDKAISVALLPTLYPDATIIVNGADMFYKVIYATYDSGTPGTWLVTYKVKTESPLEFELVEGPIAQ